MSKFMECDTCRAKPGSPPLCVGCLHNRTVIEESENLLSRIAENFETRARQIATHNQRSHTSNTQQRKNMEIMHQIWSDAAAYVRAQAPK